MKGIINEMSNAEMCKNNKKKFDLEWANTQIRPYNKEIGI